MRILISVGRVLAAVVGGSCIFGATVMMGENTDAGALAAVFLIILGGGILAAIVD